MANTSMSNFLQSFSKLKGPLSDSEYLYLLLEPVFIYGIAFGLMLFIIAFCIKHTPLQILALATVMLSALAIFPYLSMRDKAHDRIEKVYRIEAPSRADDFMQNTANRKDKLWMYLTVAITAGFAASIGPRRNRLGLLFGILCVAFGSLTIQYSLWMHYQDALFSQPHLKKSEPPVQQRMKEKNTS